MSNEYLDWLADNLTDPDFEKESRDPERIPKLLALLERGWRKNPDLRLGQIIENFRRYIPKQDLFYMEDEVIAQELINYFDLDEENNVDMKTYYQIIPYGDDHTYLGLKDGKHINCSKMENKTDLSLIFRSKYDSDLYIRRFLDPEKYKTEEIYLDEKYCRLK